jgi:glycosyltransferase involved in cell wall biosynthesis
MSAMANEVPGKRHIVFLQWGDYEFAVNRFAQGEGETYAAQRYSVEFVQSLTRDAKVTVACIPLAVSEGVASNGVHTLGLGFPRPLFALHLLRALERLAPTDLILCSPDLVAMSWALMRGCRLLPVFADSFDASDKKYRFKHRLLAGLLSHPAIEVVSNHNVPAALSLASIGVESEKIVPWDWPAQRTPYQFEPKSAPANGAPIRMIFVGAVTESKGIGDVIRAVSLLKRAGIASQLSIAGKGDALEAMRALAQSEGVASDVVFLGSVPNAEIVPAMRAHDLVVVPSRSEYSEGLPMTLYEGLCSRTPLLVSDHPMFARFFRHNQQALVFRGGDPHDLVARIGEIRSAPADYERLSRQAAATWEGIQVPTKFGDLISRWLTKAPTDRAHLLANNLAVCLARKASPVERPHHETSPRL